MPFTRNCLTIKRVRKELGQYTKDEGLENFQFQNDVLVDVIEGSTGSTPVYLISPYQQLHMLRELTRRLSRLRICLMLARSSRHLGSGTFANRGLGMLG
jgi:hypothetical protein